MLRHWELKPPSHPNAPLAERLLVYSTSRIVANPTTESSIMKNMSDLGLEDSPRATQAVSGKIGFNFPSCPLHMRLRSIHLVAQHNDFDFNPSRLDSIEKIRFGDSRWISRRRLGIADPERQFHDR